MIINLFKVRNDFLYNGKHEEIQEAESEQELEQETEQQSAQELTETIRKSKKRGMNKMLDLEKGESAEHGRNKKRQELKILTLDQMLNTNEITNFFSTSKSRKYFRKT